MKTSETKDYKSYLTQFEHLLEEYLVKKAPKIPANIKEAIVKFAPWVTLIVMILSLPAVLLVLGLGTLMMPFSFLGGVTTGVNYSVTMVFSVIVLVMEAIALPGLFKRSKKAWYLVYYASLVGALQNVISFNLGGLVIGTLLSLYLLFQVKEYYK